MSNLAATVPGGRVRIERLKRALALQIEAIRPLPITTSRPRKRAAGQRIFVLGLFSTRSGLGRGAYLLAKQFEAAGADVTRVDISGAQSRATIERARAEAISCFIGSGEGCDLVVVANPPVFRKAITFVPRPWLEQCCLVAHWAWELNRIPDFWRPSALICDEIWGSSEFVAQAIRESVPDYDGVVSCVPYPTRAEPMRPPSADLRAKARESLGLNPHTFCFGYSFAADSGYHRKNPEAAVRILQSGFSEADSVALVLRCTDLQRFPVEHARLIAAIGRDSRIQLVDSGASLTINAFYAAIDAYLAPHRAEGYGLNLAEAAQCGLPVLATGYSLGADVLAYPTVQPLPYAVVPVRDPQRVYDERRGLVWAEPDEAAFTRAAAELVASRRDGRG